MANIERIRGAMMHQPFRPFLVKLVDGTVYTVQHPDWISIPPVRRPREVTFYQVTNSTSDDYETQWIDIGLILEVILPASPSSEAAIPTKVSGE
jgi:hypothetical protein